LSIAKPMAIRQEDDESMCSTLNLRRRTNSGFSKGGKRVGIPRCPATVSGFEICTRILFRMN